jgi:hypothetical protein
VRYRTKNAGCTSDPLEAFCSPIPGTTADALKARKSTGHEDH